MPQLPTYKEESGKERLAIYAWPGGYPVFYYTGCNILCRNCAEDALEDEELEESELSYEVNWENPDLYCECGDRIESAYAEEDKP